MIWANTRWRVAMVQNAIVMPDRTIRQFVGKAMRIHMTPSDPCVELSVTLHRAGLPQPAATVYLVDFGPEPGDNMSRNRFGPYRQFHLSPTTNSSDESSKGTDHSLSDPVLLPRNSDWSDPRFRILWTNQPVQARSRAARRFPEKSAGPAEAVADDGRFRRNSTWLS